MAGLNFDDVAPASQSKAISFDDVAPATQQQQQQTDENKAQFDLTGVGGKVPGARIDMAAALLEQPGALAWQFASSIASALHAAAATFIPEVKSEEGKAAVALGTTVGGAIVGAPGGMLGSLAAGSTLGAAVVGYTGHKPFPPGMPLGDRFMEEYNRSMENAASMYVPITEGGAALTKQIGEVFEWATSAYPDWQFEHTAFLPTEIRAGGAAAAKTALNAALLLLTLGRGKATVKPGEVVKGHPAASGTAEPTYQEVWQNFADKYPATASAFEASNVGKVRTEDFVKKDKTIFDAVDRKLNAELQLPEDKKNMTLEGKLRMMMQKTDPNIPLPEIDKAVRATLDGLTQLDQLRVARANDRGLPLIPDPAISKEPVVVTKGGVAMTPEQAAAGDVAFQGMTLEERAGALGLSAMGRRRLELEKWQQAQRDGNTRAANAAKNQLERNWARDFPWRDPAKRASGLERFINFGGRMTWEEAASNMGKPTRDFKQRGSVELPPKGEDNVVDLITKPLREFAAGWQGQVQSTVAEMKKKAAEYTKWEYSVGDRIRSRKTDKIYEITGQSWDLKKDEPRYYYKTPDGESGEFIPDKMKGAFVKMTGPVRPKQEGMIEVEGFPSPREEAKKAASSRPWSVGSQEQDRTQATKLEAAYNANFAAEEEGIKVSFGEKANQLKRGIFGHNIDLKDALEKSGAYGEKARLRMVLQNAATDAARYDADQINQNIFIPLSAEEKVALDKLIRDRVIIEIKARDPGYRVPEGVDGQTAEAHARQMARTMGDDAFRKIEDKADAVFNVYRQELLRGFQAGLYDQATFDKLIHFDYEPTQYIDLIDPVQQFTVRGKTTSVRGSGIPFLGRGKTNAAVRMDSRALLFELIARNRNREFKNNTLQALWDLADTTPDNGIVAIQGKGETGKHPPSGWSALGLRIEGEQRQLLMKDEFAEQFVNEPQGMHYMVANAMRVASFSGSLRATAVGMNPIFPIAGIPMDIAHTWAAAGAEYSPHIPKYLAQIATDMIEVLGDKEGHAQAMREGLGSHYMTAYGQEIFTRNKTLAEKMSPSYQRVKHVLQGFNQEADIWIRRAHRNRLIKMGLPSWEATARARDRLDYSESGILTRSVDTVWPWTSVAMEALYKAGKAGVRDPKDFAIKMAWVFGAYTAWDMANMVASPETWKRISTSDKLRGLDITYGDQLYVLDQDGNKRYFYTPLRFDQVFSPIQGTVVGALELAEYGRLPNNLISETINQTFNIWNPLDGVPIMGAAAAMMNFDPYTGKKIFQGTVKPQDETRPSTHPLFVTAGEFTGLSPERMQAASSKMASPWNPFIMAAGYGLRMLLGDSDYRAKARISDQILAENLRPIIKLTNPMSGMVDSLQEELEAEGSHRKKQTDAIDELVFGARHGSNSMKDVSTYISTQPQDDRERLHHRALVGYNIDQIMSHYQERTLSDVPPKAWWRATGAAPAKVRAQEFYNKWLSADPAGRQTMQGIAEALQTKGTGYLSEEFKRELAREKSLLGSENR